MRFMVHWKRNAQMKLADIWNNATDRAAISDAANPIDRMLPTAPDTQGQPYYGDRILYVAPLHVVFAVVPADCRVEVLDVWHD